jgi:hypothetical protein
MMISLKDNFSLTVRMIFEYSYLSLIQIGPIINFEEIAIQTNHNSNFDIKINF